MSGVQALHQHATGSEDEDRKRDQPIFIYIDGEGVLLYPYTEWRKIQSELLAGFREPHDFEGKWLVVLPDQDLPEAFTVTSGQDVRHDDPEGVVYGHRDITIKGESSSASYCGSMELWDI